MTKVQERTSLRYDNFQFESWQKTSRYPVSAKREGSGSNEIVTSPGLDFSDYQRAHVVRNKLCSGRRLPTPEWALSDIRLREVICLFLERKIGFRSAQPGTYETRIQRVRERTAEVKEARKAVLDGLCREFVVCKDPDRKELLRREISNVDSQLCSLDRAPEIVASICYLYFRLGYESVQVAAELGIRPESVRQTVCRLNRLAENPDKRKVHVCS